MLWSLFCQTLVRGGGGINYNYLDNPRYLARLSTFELDKKEAEVVFAGDSLTERGTFCEYFTVPSLNRGIGSDTTEGLYNRIGEIVSHKPHKVFIMIGSNDIGGYNIPKETTLMFYQEIIDTLCKELPNSTIYVQSILPNQNIKYSVILEYNDSIRQMCNNNQTVFIDLCSSFMNGNEQNLKLYSSDGVHLNGSGYKTWYDIIEPLVY